MEISAQVALPAKRPSTAAPLKANQPAKNVVDVVRRNSEEAGLRLEHYVRTSLSMSGPASLPECYFETRFRELKSYELPLNELRVENVAGLIETVVLTPCPTFGLKGSGP
jgi:hypothetical protein